MIYGVDAKIYRSRDAWERDRNRDDIRPGEPTLQRIERTKKLCVGYSDQATPFAYFNKEGRLVGYDIAYAYDLARSLNVKLELIPFEWNNLTADLEHQRMDIVMSGSYVTEERLKTITVSQPYFQSPTALIVPSRKADLFMSEFTIKTLSHLKVAVLNAPVGRPFVRRIFPGAEIVVLRSFDELPAHPEIDAALWTFLQGLTWAALHPGYTAVVPKNLGSVMMFAYMMPPKSADLARFVNYWLTMRKADGFEKRQRDYWIMCKPRQDRKHRWCVIRNVLHWVD